MQRLVEFLQVALVTSKTLRNLMIFPTTIMSLMNSTCRNIPRWRTRSHTNYQHRLASRTFKTTCKKPIYTQSRKASKTKQLQRSILVSSRNSRINSNKRHLTKEMVTVGVPIFLKVVKQRIQ